MMFAASALRVTDASPTLSHMDRVMASTFELRREADSSFAWRMGSAAYSAYRSEAGAAGARAYRGCPIIVEDSLIGIGLHRQGRLPHA